MKKVKPVWSASSIPECVIASVILIVVFLMSMDILSRMAIHTTEQESVLGVTLALREGFRELGDGKHAEGNYTFVYGEIRVEACLTLYGGHIQQLVLTAFPSRGTACVKRYHLIEKEHEY